MALNHSSGHSLVALFALLVAGCSLQHKPPSDARVDAGPDIVTQDVAQDVDIVVPPDELDVPDDVPDVIVDNGPCGALSMCGTSCVNTQTDIRNCGMCSNMCRGANIRCTNGMCVCPTGFCRDATTMDCVQTGTNQNCASCGNRCTNGASCVGGTCRCPSGSCDLGATIGCIDPQTNPQYCGTMSQCGPPSTLTQCTTNVPCVAGVCDASCTTSGSRFCTLPDNSMICVNLLSNIQHCGMCNNACSPGQVCIAGGCQCPVGQILCGTTCVSINSNTNCGACGTSCTGNKSCRPNGTGSFACSCASNEYDCGGTCVPRGTVTNCAGCGMACASPRSCNTTGVDTYTCGCPTGQIGCTSGSTTTCVTSVSDNNNCGGCGIVCPTGATCTSGLCLCPVGAIVCGSSPGTCVNLRGSDNSNCGACGRQCNTPSESCVNGACSCSTLNQISCPGTADAGAGGDAGFMCVSRTASPNCGVCGQNCGALTCALDTTQNLYTCQCPSGQEFCTTGCKNPATDYMTDMANCGGCNRACFGAGRVCVGGQCICNPATHHSDAACGGVCVPKSNTACASCGDVCTANSTCTNGTCACNAGTIRCPNSGTPFTCSVLSGDRANCGSCGRACSPIGSCVAGNCTCPGNTVLNATTFACDCPSIGMTFNAATQTCECPAGKRVCTTINVCTAPNDHECCGSGMSDCNGFQSCDANGSDFRCRP